MDRTKVRPSFLKAIHCLFNDNSDTVEPRRTLADFLSAGQKIFTCRLVCGEFRQVCDKIGAYRAKSDSARSQNVLSGHVRVRWTQTIGTLRSETRRL